MSQAGEGQAIKWIRYHANYEADFCLIFPFCRIPNGYGVFGYLGEQYYAHRFMCEFVNGPPPSDKHEAAHSCGNGDGGCVNPRHLSWKTKSENRLDALKHGTGVITRGGNVGSLTPEQVNEIRELKGKMLQREIAEKFGVSEPRVRAIFSGKIYKAERKIDNWTAEQDAKVREGVARGLTKRQIAELVGRSEGAVTGRVRRLGIGGKTRVLTPQEVLDIRTRTKAIGVGKMAAHHGVCRETIYRILDGRTYKEVRQSTASVPSP